MIETFPHICCVRAAAFVIVNIGPSRRSVSDVREVCSFVYIFEPHIINIYIHMYMYLSGAYTIKLTL